MQEMHTLQQSLQQQHAEPPHDASDHVEDDDPTAVEAEAACLWAEAARRAAAGGGGGGRGRGGGRGHDAGFGNFGGANRRPQFLVVHSVFLLEVLHILMLMIIQI